MAAKKSTSPTSQEKPENERVTVFGERVDERDIQRDYGGGLMWGVILILAGIVFLLNTFSLIPWTIWGNIWKFWPILLILWGLQVILGHSRFARAVMAVIIFLFLVAVVTYAVALYNEPFRHSLPNNFSPMFQMMGGWQR